MNIQLRYGRTGTRRRILPWAVASVLMVAIAWPGLIVDAPAHAANVVETVDSWIDQILQRGGIKRGQAPEPTKKPAPLPSFPKVLRLTLDDAMALFLKQNLDLIIASYGIDAAKGRQITARLYPNPTLSVSTLSAYTQGCNIEKCGAVAPSLTQLFEVAGRRGYRMEAAALDTMSIEAKFEDAVRQLGFTLKETYFRVQRQRGHLAVDQEVQSVLIKLLQGFTGEGKKAGQDLDRVRLGLHGCECRLRGAPRYAADRRGIGRFAHDVANSAGRGTGTRNGSRVSYGRAESCEDAGVCSGESAGHPVQTADP